MVAINVDFSTTIIFYTFSLIFFKSSVTVPDPQENKESKTHVYAGSFSAKAGSLNPIQNSEFSVDPIFAECL